MTLENFKKTKMKEIAEFSTRISAEAWVGPLKGQILYLFGFLRPNSLLKLFI